MKLSTIRGGVEFLVGIGAGMIADNAISMVKPQNLGTFKSIAVKAGSAAISLVVVDKVTDHIDQIWERTETQIKNIFVKEVKEDENETEV